ncbi:hypothetical protein [Thermocatellispora tengchongensis]|uniref:hypothetical protein n=1 Tax=Thermocatellispora tengchongensis TaxID=1073253 RepID=UPI0036378B0D
MSPASVIGWTMLSIVVPGAAHLRSGRRRIGFALLGVFLALIVAGVVVGVSIVGNPGALVRDSTLITTSVLAGVGALAWFVLVLTSYITLKPDRLNGTGQIVTGIVAGVLCVAVMAPFASVTNLVIVGRDTVNQIFAGDPEGTTAPIKQHDPWNGRDRVNFLLIGGDAAGNRTGVRTDSMTVASVHVKTGNTVMFSLPRNLQHVHFPRAPPWPGSSPTGSWPSCPTAAC